MSRRYLTTREAADQIELVYGDGCCDEAKIRRHIREGRLEAEVVRRACLPGRTRAKPTYRIFPDQFRAYLMAYWPRATEGGW